MKNTTQLAEVAGRNIVLMFIFLHNKIDLLLENPLAGQFQFKNPALATVNNDNNNNFCVVDDSGQRIVILNWIS